MNTILVFRPDHIGDVILTTPVFQALRLGFPHAHIAVLIGSWARDILSGNPDVDETIICNLPGLARAGKARWKVAIAVMNQLRRRRFDAIVNLRTAASTASFSRLCGGETRWGFDVPKARWAWTHSIPFDPTRHVVDAALDLVGAMDCPFSGPANLRLFPDEQARQQAALLLEEISPPFVILHQGAGYPAKLWEADRWHQVADWIAERGFSPVFSGSPAEKDAIDQIRRRMIHPSFNLAGRCDLMSFAEIIGRSSCMVTVDSASMHMAVAMRTPVVALFGPTASRRWGPYPNGCTNIVIEKRGDCRFCKLQKGCAERKCMKMIETTEVIEALEQLL
jgi:predicted lipopolysaccharide heptosyltransferase III